MKVYFIEKSDCDEDRACADIYCDALFHGIAKRCGLNHPLPKKEMNPSIHGGVREPLEIIRSGCCAPDVFMPVPWLVVSERVKQSLIDIPNIEFLEVRFRRVVRWDYSVERDQARLKSQIADPDHILESLPDEPELYGQYGNYYELLTARIDCVLDRYDPPTLTALAMNKYKHKSLLSSQMLRDYPIIWELGHFFNENAYQRISPFIDTDYFDVKEDFLDD